MELPASHVEMPASHVELPSNSRQKISSFRTVQGKVEIPVVTGIPHKSINQKSSIRIQTLNSTGGWTLQRQPYEVFKTVDALANAQLLQTRVTTAGLTIIDKFHD